MEKLIRRTVTMTIIETWTITWADGAETTVVYQTMQRCPALPASANEPQGWTELKAIETHSRSCTPAAPTGAGETSDETGDRTG